MKKIWEIIKGALALIGVFLSGVLAFYIYSKRKPPRSDLNEMDAGDVVDTLDNADDIRRALDGYARSAGRTTDGPVLGGVRGSDHERGSGGDKDNLFHRGWMDTDEPLPKARAHKDSGGSVKDSGNSSDRKE